MSVIRVKCTDQTLKILEAPVVASGGVNEIKVEFHFCEKWDGFAKTAIFYRDESDIYYALVDENDTCIVPWEVCWSDGNFYFGVFGEKDDVRRTSVIMRYKVKKGIMTESMMPSEPTPEIYDQIMAEVARIRAENGDFTEQVNTALNEIRAENEAFTTQTNAALETFAEQANEFVEATNKAVGDINAEKNAFVAEANHVLEEERKEHDTFMESANDTLEEIKKIGAEAVLADIKAIKADIAELKYVPIEFGSFTVSPSVAEYGSTVKTVYLNWSLNKPVVSQHITSTSMEGTEELAATDRSKTYDGLSLTKRETYTLVVEDEKKSIAQTAAIPFYKPVYCGAMDADKEIDRAAVLSLERRLASSRNITFTATTGANQKLTFVQPSNYTEPVFTIDNFPYSWVPVKVLEKFENSSGYVESYTVWQEPEIIPGTSTVKVT